MSKPLFAWHATVLVAITALLAWSAFRSPTMSPNDDYPRRPIQVVVPYAAGGGSDTFVRILQKGIVEGQLLPQPLVIINQAGGSGTIGSRVVKDAQPDGYKILCHHNAIITARLTETVAYGPEAFEPIALTGEMSMVILVRADSRFKNVVDLLEFAKANPKAVRFGANKGAPAYFTALQLEQAWPGAELSIVSSGGGADRYSKILGGHLQAGVFSLSEYLDFRGVEGTPPQRDIRAIAVLNSERHEAIAEVPTASEMGVPVVLQNANYWWAPKGTPKQVIDTLATALSHSMQRETVLRELRRLRMDPTFDRGPSLRRRLVETSRQFETVAADERTPLPDFSVYVGAIVAILFVCVLIESRWRREQPSLIAGTDAFVVRPELAAACFMVLCGYVLLLGRGWLPFGLLTTGMVLAMGSLMFRGQKGSPIVLAELALVTGLGAQFVFTEIFVTALP